MRNTWKILAAAALAACGGCFRPVLSDVELAVPDMKTEAAARVVEQSLSDLNAGRTKYIRQVEADWTNGVVRVRYDNVGLGLRNLQVAIVHAGFAVDDLPADEEARAKLSAAAKGE